MQTEEQNAGEAWERGYDIVTLRSKVITTNGGLIPSQSELFTKAFNVQTFREFMIASSGVETSAAVDTRPINITAFSNQSGNEATLIAVTHSLQAFTFLYSSPNSQQSILHCVVQHLFILLASLVPRPSFLCMPCRLVKNQGLHTFSGKTCL